MKSTRDEQRYLVIQPWDVKIIRLSPSQKDREGHINPPQFENILHISCSGMQLCDLQKVYMLSGGTEVARSNVTCVCSCLTVFGALIHCGDVFLSFPQPKVGNTGPGALSLNSRCNMEESQQQQINNGVKY